MAVEEITKHLFVAMMMQRLEALEVKQTDVQLENRLEVSEENPSGYDVVENMQVEVTD